MRASLPPTQHLQHIDWLRNYSLPPKSLVLAGFCRLYLHGRIIEVWSWGGFCNAPSIVYKFVNRSNMRGLTRSTRSSRRFLSGIAARNTGHASGGEQGFDHNRGSDDGESFSRYVYVQQVFGLSVVRVSPTRV